MDNQKWLSHSNSSVPCFALLARRFKLVAGLPTLLLRSHGRLLAKHESELRHFRQAGEIPFRAIFVAGLVVAMVHVILRLRFAPRGVVAFVFQSLTDRKGWDADARHTEMIGAVVMAGLRPRIRANR